MPINSAYIEKAIFDLLDARAPGKTVCPSEVARKLAPDDWRPLMLQVRAVAVALAGKGALDILQKGRAIAHGLPIRGRFAWVAPTPGLRSLVRGNPDCGLGASPAFQRFGSTQPGRGKWQV